jgi:hypothetical protein
MSSEKDSIEQKEQQQENTKEKKDMKEPSRFKKWISSPQGKKQFIIGLVVAVILVGAGVSAYKLTRTEDDDAPVAEKKNESLPTLEEKKPTTVTSKYDGLQYAPEVANRAPLGVIIENHPDARPQSGLDKASMVFEAISEGGITRFLAVYGPQDAEKIGPVRSARTYFLDWVEGIGAFFGHCGGNIDALDRLEKESVNNLDQFANSGAYWRDNSRKVASEHTLYTSTAKLYEVAKDKGWNMDAKFDGYTFKDDPKEDQRPAAQTININFSSPQFAVKYTYNPKENNYLRFLGGVAHKDAQTNDQIKVKNIAVIDVKRVAGLTRINESGYTMTTVGTGKATFFIDGKQVDGTWSKEKTTSMIVFKDSQGKTVEFSRGNLWIEVMPAGESSSTLTVQ